MSKPGLRSLALSEPGDRIRNVTDPARCRIQNDCVHHDAQRFTKRGLRQGVKLARQLTYAWGIVLSMHRQWDFLCSVAVLMTAVRWTPSAPLDRVLMHIRQEGPDGSPKISDSGGAQLAEKYDQLARASA